MKFLVCLALFTVALVSAVPLFKVGSLSFSAREDALFQRFKIEFGKAYLDEHDESYRKSVFLANLAKIEVHNFEAAHGNHTHTLAMNKFGDLTAEEFKSKYTGYKPNAQKRAQASVQDVTEVEVPSSVDWTTQGAVTDVKNQGDCGSCWAFSSTGALEGAWFLSQGELVSLSEQQLMDCSAREGNESCEGGDMDAAFEYYERAGGACTEEKYPYEEKDEKSCRSCTKVATVSDFHDVGETESALMKAVAKQPVAVAIEADQDSFQFYEKGVLTGKCGTKLDHGVLVVGYGNLEGTDFWKVKNSWGADWGMDGFILVERGASQRGGKCGILKSAVYPVV